MVSHLLLESPRSLPSCRPQNPIHTMPAGKAGRGSPVPTQADPLFYFSIQCVNFYQKLLVKKKVTPFFTLSCKKHLFLKHQNWHLNRKLLTFFSISPKDRTSTPFHTPHACPQQLG